MSASVSPHASLLCKTVNHWILVSCTSWMSTSTPPDPTTRAFHGAMPRISARPSARLWRTPVVALADEDRVAGGTVVDGVLDLHLHEYPDIVAAGGADRAIVVDEARRRHSGSRGAASASNRTRAVNAAPCQLAANGSPHCLSIVILGLLAAETTPGPGSQAENPRRDGGRAFDRRWVDDDRSRPPESCQRVLASSTQSMPARRLELVVFLHLCCRVRRRRRPTSSAAKSNAVLASHQVVVDESVSKVDDVYANFAGATDAVIPDGGARTVVKDIHANSRIEDPVLEGP